MKQQEAATQRKHKLMAGSLVARNADLPPSAPPQQHAGGMPSLGVYRAVGAILSAFLSKLSDVLHLISEGYVFFENYGWRILIGGLAAVSFVPRVAEEVERRRRVRSAREAGDPDRVRALDARRGGVVGVMDAVHQDLVSRRKAVEVETRLRALEKAREKAMGDGKRLGT